MRTSAPAASQAVSSHVTCAGFKARRICYPQSALLQRDEDQREEDQPASLQRDEDQREEDHRDEDQREEDQREESQPASLQRDEDQRDEDQREEARPLDAGNQSSPVQVTPSHLPPDQADKLEVACHQAAAFQGVPWTSISPERSLPSASTRTDPPRAASIDPCPVELGKSWTAAARRFAAALPLRVK